jgi:hypothetical protein
MWHHMPHLEYRHYETAFRTTVHLHLELSAIEIFEKLCHLRLADKLPKELVCQFFSGLAAYVDGKHPLNFRSGKWKVMHKFWSSLKRLKYEEEVFSIVLQHLQLRNSEVLLGSAQQKSYLQVSSFLAFSHFVRI